MHTGTLHHIGILHLLALVAAMALGLALPLTASAADSSIPAFKQVCAGQDASYAVSKSGDLYAWGDDVGQMGLGKSDPFARTGAGYKPSYLVLPTKIASKVSFVDAPDRYNMAYITTDGSLYLCGDGEYGTIGNGSYESYANPVKVMDDVVDVSLGIDTVAAVTRSGDLYTWGRATGALGDGSEEDRGLPKKIMTGVKDVELGDWSGYAITDAGDLYAWGSNNYGEIGNGKSGSLVSQPVKILDDVQQVSCGGCSSLALKTDGSVWSWGDNSSGKLANGEIDEAVKHQVGWVTWSTSTPHPTPQKAMDDVKYISCGYWHCAAVKKNGDVVTWGSNSYGQLGNDTTENSALPVTVVKGCSSVSAGSQQTLALTSSGQLKSWGGNESGQLGIGTIDYEGDKRTTPQTPSKVNNAPKIVTGQVDVDMDGSFDLNAGYQLLASVNKARTKAGKSTLGWNAGLEAAALKRAAELTLVFDADHIRPNGDTCFSIYPQDADAKAENIAAGQSTVAAVNKAWTQSEGHYQNMINGNMKSMAAACFVSNGKRYWVEAFSSQDPDSQRASQATVKKANKNIHVIRRHMGFKLAGLSSMDKGEVSQAAVLGANGGKVSDSEVAWHTSDARVATVGSAGRVKAIGNGTAKIWATIDGASDVVASKTLKVGTDGTAAKASSKAASSSKMASTFKSGGCIYRITGSKSVTLVKAEKLKKSSVTVNKVKHSGKTYRVTKIAAKAFSKNGKVKTVVIGARVQAIGSQAFSKAKRLNTLVIKSKKLTAGSVKGSLKGSKVKTVKVKVSSAKRTNAKYVSKYQKAFCKKNSGKKVTVR